jgi:glutaredoxin 2
MKNEQKLEIVIAKIKAVKGNISAKRDRIKFYTESLEFGRFDRIDIEEIERFDFEREVINRQIAINLHKKSRSKKSPYTFEEFEQDLNKIKNLAKTV